MSTLVYCNGEPLLAAIFSQISGDISKIIAADGGARHVFDHNRIPYVIIGDMDSFSPTEELANRVITDPDQETNDLEKALHYCAKAKFSEIIVAGATGLRLDHSLKNLSVLLRFQSVFTQIQFIDNFGYHRIVRSGLPVSTYPGQTISLMPLCGKTTNVSTSGLKFSLTNEALEMGRRDGSSNEALGRQIVVRYDSGPLLISLAH